MFAPLVKAPAKIRQGFVDARWGELCVTPLLLSAFSGVVLAFKYDVSAPYSSVVSIDLLAPFGAFVRSLHYYSSQLFFIFFLFHLGVILMRIRAGKGCEASRSTRTPPAGRREGMKQWLQLLAALPVVTLLLFSGYVLKMDATGRAAGAVAENILLSMPVFGAMVNRFLFAISENSLKVVYADHLAGLPLVLLLLLWGHLHRYRFRVGDHGMMVALLFFSSLVIPAPLVAEQLGVAHISGPWFFVGLQELLRYIQPFWAGIVFPALPLVVLAIIPARGWKCRWGTMAFGIWFLLYLGLSLVGWWR